MTAQAAEAPTTLVITDRDAHPHKWATGLVGTVCREPCFLGLSCVCTPCSNVVVRRQALKASGSHYRCFQHHFLPCVGRCIPGQRVCPCCCMVLEAHCCPVLSSLATRYTIQDKFMVKRTCMERACTRVLCLCSLISCCCSKDSCWHEVTHALSHCCLCAILPCLNAQAYHELKVARRGTATLNEALLVGDN